MASNKPSPKNGEVPSPAPSDPTTPIYVRVGLRERDALRQLAHDNLRSISGEARRLIREALAARAS